MLVDIDERKNRQGRLYARLTFEDLVDSFELTLFSDDWERYGTALKTQIFQPVYLLLESFTRSDGQIDRRILEIGPLSEAPPPSHRHLLISIRAVDIREETLMDWERTLQKYAGRFRVRVRIEGIETPPVLMETPFQLRYTPDLRSDLEALSAHLQICDASP